MVDLAPPIEPGVYGAENADGPAVTIDERRGLHILHLAGDLDDADFPTLARGALGLPLPQLAGETRDNRAVRILWLAPDRWLAVSAHAIDMSALSAIAAVNDVAQGRTVLRLAGPKVRDLLRKGCPLDLDPAAFPSGRAAATLLGHLNVIMDCVADDSFDLYVTRSYDQFVRDWLVRAAKEFGVRVNGRRSD